MQHNDKQHRKHAHKVSKDTIINQANTANNLVLAKYKMQEQGKFTA